ERAEQGLPPPAREESNREGLPLEDPNKGPPLQWRGIVNNEGGKGGKVNTTHEKRKNLKKTGGKKNFRLWGVRPLREKPMARNRVFSRLHYLSECGRKRKGPSLFGVLSH